MSWNTWTHWTKTKPGGVSECGPDLFILHPTTATSLTATSAFSAAPFEAARAAFIKITATRTARPTHNWVASTESLTATRLTATSLTATSLTATSEHFDFD